MDNETKKMFEMLMGKLDAISENQKNMEIRQDEIFSVVKAIEHSNTTHKSEIDNITFKIAHTEGTINNIGNVINESRAVK
ncbi:M domain protein [Clostridium estertheticum]|uniref:M domain protein n=1 Tax=Clostridium estertheticum TaxID=238834 RepID=A0A5N7ISG7_9CLOT|nr:M domain protein [Clostridium estertheticum]MPQ33260.1 M domain protein [Clostridium estertheticum]MPQ63918.1 M domain protein [Clostridium estertheticum]